MKFQIALLLKHIINSSLYKKKKNIGKKVNFLFFLFDFYFYYYLESIVSFEEFRNFIKVSGNAFTKNNDYALIYSQLSQNSVTKTIFIYLIF